MSDITEKLRRKVFRGPTMEASHIKTLEWEAADEIDRLRAEVERLRAGGCARDQNTTQYCAEAARLAAENEKLRAEDEAIRAEFGGKRDGRPTIECLRDAFAAKLSDEDTLFQATLDMKTGELWAEVERLSSVLREWQIQAIDAETESARLAAENERLRTALEWYGEQARLCRLLHSEKDAGRKALADDGGRRARAALEGRTALQDKSDVPPEGKAAIEREHAASKP